MSPLQVEVVTPEGRVYQGPAREVEAVTSSGAVAILPRHAPLLADLVPGALRIVPADSEPPLDVAIGGGFIEVRDDLVIVLADTAEEAEAIDVERARKAREAAERLLRERPEDADLIRAEAALRKSMARLKVAERARRRGGRAGGADHSE